MSYSLPGRLGVSRGQKINDILVCSELIEFVDLLKSSFSNPCVYYWNTQSKSKSFHNRKASQKPISRHFNEVAENSATNEDLKKGII